MQLENVDEYMCAMSWILPLPHQNSYGETLIPSGIVFGDRAFKEVIMIK